MHLFRGVFFFFSLVLEKKSKIFIFFSIPCTNNQSFPKLPLTMAQHEAHCILISYYCGLGKVTQLEHQLLQVL